MPIKKVPLKRKNPNNPQIRSYAEAVKSGQENYHVVAVKDRWNIRQIGKTSGIKAYDTREEAITHAISMARKQKGEIIIHKRSGLIEERRSYKKKA
jgi:hypothetical protein